MIATTTRHVFHRGSLALDFIGTRGRRSSIKPVERLATPADLAEWFVSAGVADGSDPEPTASDHARALEFREALARMASAVVDEAPVADADLQMLNDAARGFTYGVFQIDADLQARTESSRLLDFALGRIALDAIETFSRRRERLTRCELASCGGLFVSGTRGDRRWCSMETCGNRAKVAAHRARRRAALSK